MYVKLGLPVEYSPLLHVWFPPIRFHFLRLPLIQDAAWKFAHSGSVQTEKKPVSMSRNHRTFSFCQEQLLIIWCMSSEFFLIYEISLILTSHSGPFRQRHRMISSQLRSFGCQYLLHETHSIFVLKL